MEETLNIIGQCLGIIAFAIFFLSYQVKDAKKLLLIQTIGTATLCVQYVLIQADSGWMLNIVCIIRNIIYYNRNKAIFGKKIFSYKFIPYALAALMVGIGIVSWQGWYSILIIVGLAINTVCLSLPDAQKIRKSVLVTCPLVLLYNILITPMSIGGIINESVSITSALIGIIRLRSAKGKIAE